MPKWGLPPNAHDRAIESEHYDRCTHRMDRVLMVKDAEQVAVLYDPRKDLIHISVHLENSSGGGGFICKQLKADVYDRMTEAEEMTLLREQMAKLKPLL